MSLETPDRPSRPLFLFSISSLWVAVSLSVAFEEREHAGVHVAAARAHDQALRRREAHRRVHRAPVIDGAERRAVAEMAAHQAQLVRAALQEFAARKADVVVRRAVEAVAAHALLLVELVGQAVEVRVGRQRVMKRRVEHGDVRHGGEQPPHLADAGDVHRVVQRRERIECLDLREHLVGDERGLGELLAAVYHAMGDDADFARAADDARFLRGEFGDHGLEGLRGSPFARSRFTSPFGPRCFRRVPSMPMRSTTTVRLPRFVGRVVKCT